MKQRGFLYVVLFTAYTTAFTTACFAQRTERFAEGRSEREGKPVLYQALFVGTADSSVRRVDIPYRVDLDFFIAARSGLASKDHPFIKKGELLFELFDSTETSSARIIEPIEDSVESSESIPGVHQWHYGMTSLSVPPGKYTVVTELTDLQSKRDYIDKNGIIRVPRLASSAAVTSVFFGKGNPGKAFPDTLEMQDLAGDYLFGSDGYLATALIGIPDTVGLQVGYTITEEGRDKGSSKLSSRVVHAAFLSRAHCSFTPMSDTSGTGYIITPNGTALGIVIPLPLARLPLRNYSLTLTVKRGQDQAEAQHRFRAVWPDMPASLRDVDGAIEALRILIPQDEVDRLDNGSFESRRDSLEAFWKARGGDTTTALNPMMAEYYRRVDVAIRSYGTLRQPNGLKSDRGRIYVLYGPPSSTRRTLTPGKPYQEVWTYDRLNKTFVFEDSGRNGNYILLSSNGS